MGSRRRTRCPSTPDSWADLVPEAHPGRAIVYTDDSWIRRFEAELLDSEGGEIAYEVEVTPLSQM